MRGSARSTVSSSRSTASVLTSITEVKRLTRYGFEWTYEGESPQQLAFAILYDYLADKQRAIGLSQPFMKEIVANFDNDWTLTDAQIEAFLRTAAAA